MADLYPTKTRLELLRAVAAGDVMWYPAALDDGNSCNLWEGPRGGGGKVTSRVSEMHAAGWIRPGDKHYDTRLSSRSWELTDAGRKVLEEAGQ